MIKLEEFKSKEIYEIDMALFYLKTSDVFKTWEVFILSLQLIIFIKQKP